MRLKHFISRLRDLPTRLNSAAIPPFRANLPLILKDLKSRSPVSKGIYKSSWKLKEGSTLGKSIIANVVFYNDDNPKKAALMEFGAYPGNAPWYYPGSQAQRFRGRSGRLTVAESRVWAGGLNPGHQHTIGGAINPVLYRNNQRQIEIAQKIANVLVRRV